jgi:hypothetical protein
MSSAGGRLAVSRPGRASSYAPSSSCTDEVLDSAGFWTLGAQAREQGVQGMGPVI